MRPRPDSDPVPPDHHPASHDSSPVHGGSRASVDGDGDVRSSGAERDSVEVGGGSGEEEEEDESREAEAEDETNEAADAVEDEPEYCCRRLDGAVAGTI